MKHGKKTSFIIRVRRSPGPAFLNPDPAKKRERPGCRRPGAEEIANLAVELAREEHDLGQRMAELFHWPAWAAPCADPRRLFLPIVEKFKKMAEETLRRHYEYYYDMAVRRQRRLRARPRPRGWTWTRKPLKRAVPPPRRRLFRPPELAYPDRGAPPPPPAPDGFPKRPGWRERERLLCFSWLFDNQIVLMGGLNDTLAQPRAVACSIVRHRKKTTGQDRAWPVVLMDGAGEGNPMSLQCALF